MIAQGTNPRTSIRDAFLAALQRINDDNSGVFFSKQAFFSKSYLEETECEGYPTYCAVVTDETFTYEKQQGATVEAKILIVIYAKDDQDPRLALDQALQDAIRAIANHSPELRQQIERIQCNAITTDEGTKVAKPFAQAVMVWSVWFTRSMSFNG